MAETNPTNIPLWMVAEIIARKDFVTRVEMLTTWLEEVENGHRSDE